MNIETSLADELKAMLQGAPLQQISQQLGTSHAETEQAVDACGILQGLAALETEAKPERQTHRGGTTKRSQE